MKDLNFSNNKIAELRKLKQMTQEELATQFNVSSQAVSRWENDLSIPDITLLIQIADQFIGIFLSSRRT